MKDKNRLVIIYSPTGKEHKYSTVDLGGDEYEVVETIEAEPGYVNIGLIEDGKAIARTYCMPYYFEIF
jgi:hypothetical protein